MSPVARLSYLPPQPPSLGGTISTSSEKVVSRLWIAAVAVAPPAFAAVGLLDLVVEVSPYRRVLRHEPVLAAGKELLHPAKL